MRQSFKLKYLCLSILSGILIALSFQKFNAFYLAWFSFVPLIICCNRFSSTKHSIIYGFIAGFVCNAISLFWLYHFLNFNLGSWIQALLISCLLWTYLAMYFAVWALSINFVQKNFIPMVTILFAPTSWMLLEYIRTYLLTGFGWNLLGYSQASFLYAIQISEIFSVYGVSFAIILINVLLFYYFRYKKKSFLTSAIIIFSLIIFYGFVRIYQVEDLKNKKVSVGIVQPNIDQYKKWDKKYKEEILSTLEQNAKDCDKEHVDIIVYPETSLPGFVYESDISSTIEKISSYSNLTLIGAPNYHGDNTYNSIFAFSNKGKVIYKHNKTHLIIFGEFIPFRNVLSKYFSIFNSLGDFSKGTQMNVFRKNTICVGPLICSENFFSPLSKNLVNNGAKILTNHTNDAWFLSESELYQHFNMNIFRAIENRKYLIVCANTGISAVIDLTGKVIKKAQINKNENIFCDVYQNDYKTIYDRIGNILFYCGPVFIVLIFFMLFMI